MKLSTDSGCLANVFFSPLHCIALGDVLHRPSVHKDTLETNSLPFGEACFCPSWWVTSQTAKHSHKRCRPRHCFLSFTYFGGQFVFNIQFYALFNHFALLDPSGVRHSALQPVICLWWRCSEAGWHQLSVIHSDSEGSEQITFSHQRHHVKLHLIASCRPLNHDMLQEKCFVTGPVRYLWNRCISISQMWLTGRVVAV